MASNYITTTEALSILSEVAPTLKIVAKDYEKASPYINIGIDYWPIVLAAGFTGIMLGSALGTMLPKWKKWR